MKYIAPTIRTMLWNLEKRADSLFDLNAEDIQFIFDKPGGFSIYNGPIKFESQLPDGIYTKISDIITLISRVRDRNENASISSSPLVMGFKEFDCCKPMKYTGGNVITQRDEEIEKVLITLCRKNKRSVVLVGPAGTGKTALVGAVHAKLLERNCPRQLIGAQIMILDIPYIFAKYKEDPISHIIKVLERASEYDKAILFVDEVHELLNQRMNNILKPYLTEQIRFIGSTTTDEFHEILASDRALERRFTVIHVEEPTIEKTTKMVISTKHIFEDAHKCQIPEDICSYLVQTGSRFLAHRKNPDKSLDILDIACSLLSEQEPKNVMIDIKDSKDYLTSVAKDSKRIDSLRTIPGNRTLTQAYVDKAISSVTGIEFGRIQNSLHYTNVLASLKESIFGQYEAIEKMANIVNIIKCVKTNRDKPLSTLLLIGPAGSGKQQACKDLTRTIYGNDSFLIPCDMSGFVSEFSITELKGAPPGYVGYGRSGWLVKAIKDNPQSIVLFKKINVAHPNIQQFIIESCRNGKMTNSAEQEVKLNNAVIIFSITLSEKEMDKILDKSSKIMGFGNEKDKKDTNLRERIDEFIGQDLSKAIDEVILFNRLEDTDLEKIYNFNLTKQLNLYENINIDLDELKKNVLKDSKNGRDIINKLSSLVPNMIFKNLLEGEKINEVNKVKVSTKHSKDHKKRTNKGPVSKANYRPCEPDEDCSKSESKS